MGSNDHWYLLCYDIRDDKRYRQAVKVIKGVAERLQYSVFRCQLSDTRLEKMRLQLYEILADEDSILFIGLCDRCVSRISCINDAVDWLPEKPRFQILD